MVLGVFQQAMRDISSSLKRTYSADALALIPGSGSYAMEAAARQVRHRRQTETHIACSLPLIARS